MVKDFESGTHTPFSPDFAGVSPEVPVEGMVLSPEEKRTQSRLAKMEERDASLLEAVHLAISYGKIPSANGCCGRNARPRRR